MASGTSQVIALWAAPRSRSTAFFRYMLEYDELLALHEPFCNILDHGATTVDGTQITTAEGLIGAIREQSARRTVFFKDTTDQPHPAVLADEKFLLEARHTFLIRRPAEVAASYFARKPDMTAAEVGLEHLHQLHEAVRAAGGEPVVIDAQDLVDDPVGLLASYCDQVGLPFRPGALNWQPGDRPEWSRTAGWHEQVSRSSGFEQGSSAYAQTVDNNAALARFSAHHEPFYRALHDRRLVPA